MQNIMFTEPNPKKILRGEKTLTARNWKRKPPRRGAVMTASTAYPKSTRFAVIRVLNVWEWELDLSGKGAEKATGFTKQQIADKEGYGNTTRPKDSWLTDWDAFIAAYYGHNAQNFLEDDRTDYFIHFQLVQRLNDDGDFFCQHCGCIEPEEFYNWTFNDSPICDDCLVLSYERRNSNPRQG